MTVAHMDQSTMTRLLLCWGKTGVEATEYHPALFHMLDAGHVAQVLLGPDASPRWRSVLALTLGIETRQTSEVVPWLVAMHDIGKVSAAFQAQDPGQAARLLASGFDLGRCGLSLPHTAVGGAFVRSWKGDASCPALPDIIRLLLTEAVSAHHGSFTGARELQDTGRRLRLDEPDEWDSLRRHCGELLRERLEPRDGRCSSAPLNVSAAVAALTGFTTLCDWIASNSAFFLPEAGVQVGEYVRLSQARALEACAAAGFLVPTTSAAPSAFARLFPGLQDPRPLQLAIDAIPDSLLACPCLIVIEAPTGEGKTEAALALAHRIAVHTGVDELYYALPTTATSNQMFLRLQRHLRDNLGLAAQARLVHGQAFLVEDDLRLESLAGGDGAEKPALEWFGPRKRALLAPFGVGTIDQAELAALNVRHSSLRQMGLAGKVVIVDEVHAYDTYMTTVVERLLLWLSTLGASVILLSATLPQKRRRALVRAFDRGGIEPDDSPAYPGLSVISQAGFHGSSPPAFQPARHIEVQWLTLADGAARAKALWLLDRVSHGGCACWITNTVKRAQAVYRELACLAGAPVDRMLLHSQFPLDRREELERELALKYGPDGRRPERGIVVGTQVLEQSLDLDFDVMVSDLAPVDLLLQRAGRLHRHRRVRPPTLESPLLCVNAELDAEGIPLLSSDRYVYAEYILRQTWEVLRGRQGLDLPGDYRTLIEAVYDAPPPGPQSPLREAFDRMQRDNRLAEQEASMRLLPPPHPVDTISDAASRLSHVEDENGSAWIVARTRLGEESVTVVPMVRDGNIAHLFPSGPALDPFRPASRERQLELLRRSLRVSARPIVAALRHCMNQRPALFTGSALLRDCSPLWLTEGRASVASVAGKWTLTLDSDLGLLVEKEGSD